MNYEPSTSQCCRFMEMDALKDAGKIKCYKSHVERSETSGGSSWVVITARFYGYKSLSFGGGEARRGEKGILYQKFKILDPPLIKRIC